MYHCLLMLYYKTVKGNQAAPSTLCLEISSAYYLVSVVTISIFHKRGNTVQSSSSPLHSKDTFLQSGMCCSFPSEILPESPLTSVVQNTPQNSSNLYQWSSFKATPTFLVNCYSSTPTFSTRVSVWVRLEDRIYWHLCFFMLTNWLTWLWVLRSPSIAASKLKTRKASIIVPVWVGKPDNQERPRHRRRPCPSSAVRLGESNFSLYTTFLLYPGSQRTDDVHRHWWGPGADSVCLFKRWSHLETPPLRYTQK